MNCKKIPKMVKNILLFLIVILVIKSVNKSEFYHNQDSSIIFYGRMSCPYCVKMKAFLDSVNFDYDYRNTEEEPGKSEYKEHGASGVPFFLNKLNGKTSSGFINDIDVFKNNLGI